MGKFLHLAFPIHQYVPFRHSAGESVHDVGRAAESDLPMNRKVNMAQGLEWVVECFVCLKDGPFQVVPLAVSSKL